MSLKIYFCGSICGGRQDEALYSRLIGLLKQYGTVLTEHVGYTHPDWKLSDKDVEWIHERDIQWLKQSDIVVAEVTQPSLGVGYEIGRAITMDKRIVCLFHPSCGRKLSCMIDGIPRSPRYTVRYYEENEVNDVINEIFAENTSQRNT